MNYEIRVTSNFEKDIKRFSKKFKGFNADLIEFLNQLRENPFLGTHLGNNIFKIRMASKAKGKGKSGGFRVITYHLSEAEKVTVINLITMYDKSEEASISLKELEHLIKSIFGS